MKLPRIDNNIDKFIDRLNLSAPESARIKRCIAGYSRANNLSEKLGIIVFRIKNLVRGYFGKSDLKLSEKVLKEKFRILNKENGKKTLIHNLSYPKTVKKIYSGNKIIKKLIKYNNETTAHKVDNLKDKLLVFEGLENKIDEETAQIIGEAAEKIIKLANNVLIDKEVKSFLKLSKYWEKANLDEKRVFVELFSCDHEKFVLVRDVFAEKVYRPIDSNYGALLKRNVVWQPRKTQAVAKGDDDFDVTEGVYFHATDEEWKEEAILKSKKVLVQHKKKYKGAFVSTKPEFGFGFYILVFKRCIERLSSLEKGFVNTAIGSKNHPYWAGFSKEIPVTAKTLAYVIVLDKVKPKIGLFSFLWRSKEKSQKDKCSKWAGRDVKVITISQYNELMSKAGNPAMLIPQEWPKQQECIYPPKR